MYQRVFYDERVSTRTPRRACTGNRDKAPKLTFQQLTAATWSKLGSSWSSRRHASHLRSSSQILRSSIRSKCTKSVYPCTHGDDEWILPTYRAELASLLLFVAKRAHQPLFDFSLTDRHGEGKYGVGHLKTSFPNDGRTSARAACA